VVVVVCLQALSGTGSLRLAAAFIARWMKGTTVYISNPTWGNHRNIFGDEGVEWKYYRYCTHGAMQQQHGCFQLDTVLRSGSSSAGASDTAQQRLNTGLTQAQADALTCKRIAWSHTRLCVLASIYRWLHIAPEVVPATAFFSINAPSPTYSD
jgi:hypothetical protein